MCEASLGSTRVQSAPKRGGLFSGHYPGCGWRAVPCQGAGSSLQAEKAVNYRIPGWLRWEGTSRDRPAQPPASRITWGTLHRLATRRISNISKEGDPTTSLGSLSPKEVHPHTAMKPPVLHRGLRARPWPSTGRRPKAWWGPHPCRGGFVAEGGGRWVPAGAGCTV